MAESDVVPPLVPARMVNEFVYCPRLFYLEWVQARFADNADTAEGRFLHRNVDRPTGGAQPPGCDKEWRMQSVSVSSLSLGVSARLDVAETSDGGVAPVETKHGGPPDNEHRAWEPERVQVCLQGLLLREEGYTCTHGFLWFPEHRERVRVDFDDDLVSLTRASLVSLRDTATSTEAPPPLVDSPKCPRCSLVTLCLPDETNLLSGHQEDRPRRLLPSKDAARPLYVTEQGVSVGFRAKRIEVSRRGEEPLLSTRPRDVSQLCVFGNAQVTTQLLKECFKRGIPVMWFSHGGWLQGAGLGLPSKHVDVRRRQTIVDLKGGLAIAQAMILGKIRNSRTLLRRNGPSDSPLLRDLSKAADKVAATEDLGELLGVEGWAARTYFAGFPGMLKPREGLPGEVFAFESRQRRPPPDALNCLLSYLYGLLTKDLVAATWSVGFDPFLGFLHRPRFGRPALALDLSEEFRPLVAESVAITLINTGEIRPHHFVARLGGVGLTADGRRVVIGAYERRVSSEVRHPTFGYKVTYRRLFELQARILAAHLLGEIPMYEAFTTR